MNLFELNQAYAELSQREDLDPAVLRDTLDAIGDARAVKLENIASWIDNLRMERDFIKEKTAAWQKEKISRDHKIEWLQAYLTNALEQMGVKSFHTENHLLKVRDFRPRTIIDNENEVPAAFVKQEIVRKVDKRALYDAIKSGKKVPGVHLEENRKATIK